MYGAVFKLSAIQLSCERENIKELADELSIQVERIFMNRDRLKKHLPIQNQLFQKIRYRFFRNKTTAKSSKSKRSRT